MSRSIKKGPFIAKSLYEQVTDMSLARDALKLIERGRSRRAE